MRRTNPPHGRQRPEDYVEELEARSRRRIGGGLLALHRRGERALGRGPWKLVLGAAAGAALVAGGRWLSSQLGSGRVGGLARLAGLGRWIGVG
jgi:hypothetical protein